jgi:hypothetical protein
MALQPFLLNLQKILEESGGNGLIRFYVDDGNITADFETMTKLLKYVIEEGPKYGFVIKQKHQVFISWASASQRKWLCSVARDVMVNELGFSESIIHIHPDNCIDEDDHSASSVLNYGV